MDDITKHPEPEEYENPRVAHETTDTNAIAITGFGIGLAISVVVVAILMFGLFKLLFYREDVVNPPIPKVVEEQRPRTAPEPTLQATPKLDLKALREGEDAVLNKGGWLDVDKGIVRIPIAMAIDMVAQKGLPSRPAAEEQRLADSAGYRMMPTKSSSGRVSEKVGR